MTGLSGALGPLALAALYGWGVARAGRRGWPWTRTAAFAAGCVALAAALAGPIETRSDDDLSAHMLQHLLVAVAAPALLAAGAPLRLAFAVLPGRERRTLARLLHRPWARALAHPAVATLLAAAVMVGVHLTGLFEAAATSPLLHALEHAALFWTALVAWMAILGVDPLPHRAGAVGALAWIGISMMAMSGVGAVLATQDVARYAHYPSVSGQHDAGAVMWLGGAAILVPASVIVAMWLLEREERRQRRREAVSR
jgi:cytochrome c oxidase assembly factor CtaG